MSALAADYAALLNTALPAVNLILRPQLIYTLGSEEL